MLIQSSVSVYLQSSVGGKERGCSTSTLPQLQISLKTDSSINLLHFWPGTIVLFEPAFGAHQKQNIPCEHPSTLGAALWLLSQKKTTKTNKQKKTTRTKIGGNSLWSAEHWSWSESYCGICQGWKAHRKPRSSSLDEAWSMSAHGQWFERRCVVQNGVAVKYTQKSPRKKKKERRYGSTSDKSNT